MPFTVYARQDSITANNSTLNPIGTNQAPTTELTFKPASPTGDQSLETNGGAPDPDTLVTINGTDYQFTVLLTGTLPNNSQVPDGVPATTQNMVGREVMLIRVVVGGQPREYFFVLGDPVATQATMNDFGNGAIPLGNVDTTPDPYCFVAGTEIATPSGSRKVEGLEAGDLVITAEGETKQVMWVGTSRRSLRELTANPDLRPIVIRADAFGPGLPKADLMVSPQHRVMVADAACALLFGEDTVLVPAKHLVGTLADVAEPEGEVLYVHVLLQDHDMLLSNGLATESFQPARRLIDVMSDAARSSLEAVLSALGEEALLSRKDRYLSLRRSEAEVLLDLIARRMPLAPASQGREAALSA